MESTSSGYLAAVAMAYRLAGLEPPELTKETAIGALGLYISDETVGAFQPMNVNFSIISPMDRKIKPKSAKNLAISERALARIDAMAAGELSCGEYRKKVGL